VIYEGPDFKRCDDKLIEGYMKTTPATIGHMLFDGFADLGIRPVYKRMKLVGTAFTVQLARMDIAAITRSYELSKPGDILVVNSGTGSVYACAGEISTIKSIRLKVKGLIVDGPVTDILEMEAMQFPCFSRGVSALVGRRLGNDGAVRVPVNIGGVVVNSGDLVVADDNGIVFLNPEKAEELLPKLLEKEMSEDTLRAEFWKEMGKDIPVIYP